MPFDGRAFVDSTVEPKPKLRGKALVEDVAARVARDENISTVELFMAMATHMFEQGHQAVAFGQDDNGHSLGGGVCCYRTDHGDTCVIGRFIPDSSYCKDMEGVDIEGILRRMYALYSFRGHVYMLKRLQLVHDSTASWRTPQRLGTELISVAQMLGLSTLRPEIQWLMDEYKDCW